MKIGPNLSLGKMPIKNCDKYTWYIILCAHSPPQYMVTHICHILYGGLVYCGLAGALMNQLLGEAGHPTTPTN